MVSSAESSTVDRGTGPEDLILVRNALRGEPRAVAAVLGRLSCIVRFVSRLDRALGYGLGPQRLEDVVQQVYAAVWPRLADYAAAGGLESWVYGFCRNCLRAEARRGAGTGRAVAMAPHELDRREHAAADAAPAEALARAERNDAVLAELSRLRPDEREVVRLRHLEGWSFEEIARHLELPASTVKDRCYRALTTLKGRLERRDVTA